MSPSAEQTSGVQVARWLETHDTAWCVRFSVLLTPAGCAALRSRSEVIKGSDFRCAGCGGLDNQAAAGRSFLTLEVVECPKLDENVAGIGEPEKEDCHYDDLEKQDPDSDYVQDFGLTDFDQKLVAMLDADCEDEEPRPVPEKKGKRRFAVFTGRCRRCDGYMSNVPEPHDNAVYHCLGCGWRTSPGYEQNRLYARRERGNN